MLRIKRTVERAAEVLLVTIFSLVVMIAFLQVIFRYVLQAPLVWSGEAASYLHICAVYLGSALAWPARDHLRLDVLDQFYGSMSAWAVSLVNLGLGVCGMLFLAAAAYGMFGAAEYSWNRPIIIMPWLKLGWIFAFAGTCILYILLRLAADLCGLAWRSVQSKETTSPW